MKIIQQDKKVIACIGKDDTNERKIIEMIENVQDDGITDFEVDAENPRLYSKDGLLYGKKKMMPNGKARLTLIAVPPDKKGTVEIAPGTEMIASDAFTDSKASKVIRLMMTPFLDVWLQKSLIQEVLHHVQNMHSEIQQLEI